MRQAANPAVVVGWQVLAIMIVGMGVAWVVGFAPPLFAFGAVAAVISCLVFIQRPDIGLMLLLIMRASSDATLGSFAAAIGPGQRLLSLVLSPNTALILILIVAGGFVVLARGLPILSLPVGIMYALLLLTGLVGVLRADSLVTSFSAWLPVVSTLIVYALAASLFREAGRVQKVVDVIAASFIVPAILGFSQLVQGVGRFETGVTRIEGSFVHPNPFAFYLVTIFGVFLCQTLTQRGRRKWVSLGVVAASLPLLLATYTRGAWVGVGVVLLVVGVLQFRRLLVLIPLVVAAGYRFIPSIGTRLADPFGGSFAGRLEIWSFFLRQWMEATSRSQAFASIAMDRLTGLGPGSFETLMPGTFPHNDYLRVLMEYGVFGLLLFIAVFIVLVGASYRVWRRSRGLSRPIALGFLALAVAYPVMSLTDNLFAMTVNQVYFWTLAGLVAAVGRIGLGDDAVLADRPLPGFRGSRSLPADSVR